ncbi:MAG: hypothetical protein JWN17_1212 [Frankiales bacterium]|nr:hypothetical protein [Frankiales bacterium]
MTEQTLPPPVLERLAGLRLAETTLAGVMDTICVLTKETVPGASDVSVTVLDERRAATVASTGELATALDEGQYARGHGPCLDSIAGAEPVHIPSMTQEQRWPDFAQQARELGAGSSVSLPMPLQREISAALNVYSRQEHAIDDTSVALARTFAAYAGIALANVHLHEAQTRTAAQLQEAMRSRAVIEQAKGILMGQRRIPADAAFDLLVRLSQDSQRKLRDVAEALVASAVAGEV